MLTKRGTKTTPELLKGGTLEGPDVVTALNLYATDTLYVLPRGVKRVMMGSEGCGIAIRSDFVSAKHCELVRRIGRRLRVDDQRSKNGTWFEGAREATFYLKPGQVFIVGALPHRFVALNDQMRAVYPELVDILGAEDEHALRSETPSPSDLILSAINGGHLLITSEGNCEQQRLARIIHEISRLRTRAIVEPEDIHGLTSPLLNIVERDLRSTLVLNLEDSTDKLPEAALKALFSPPHQTRVIALARSVDVAIEALGVDNVAMMQRIWLRPLALRRRAIHRLLDRLFEQGNSSLRFAHMSPENRHALRQYSWPDNFASLRQAADYLIAIAKHPSLNQAARALKIPTTNFYRWYSDTIGLKKR